MGDRPHVYIPVLFYTMIVGGILDGIEELAVLRFLKEHRENVRGLYWMLKEMKTARLRQSRTGLVPTPRRPQRFHG